MICVSLYLNIGEVSFMKVILDLVDREGIARRGLVKKGEDCYWFCSWIGVFA